MTYLFTFLLLMVSCFSRPAMMTRSSFDEIQVGESVAELKQKVGDPYAVHKQENGTEEYEYIERIDLGTETVEENRYTLVIKDGKVAAKRFNQQTPPAYDELYDGDPNDVELQ